MDDHPEEPVPVLKLVLQLRNLLLWTQAHLVLANLLHLMMSLRCSTHVLVKLQQLVVVELRHEQEMLLLGSVVRLATLDTTHYFEV